MRAVLAALVAHWWRHKVQAAALLVGLAMATALWSGVQAINAHARASYDRAAGMFQQSALPRIVSRSAQPLPDTLFGELRRAGIAVTPVLTGTISVGGQRVSVLGIEPVTAPSSRILPQDAGSDEFLSFISAGGRVFAAPDVVELVRSQPGFPPVQAATGLAPGTVLADIGIAQGLLQSGRVVSYFLVTASPSQATQAALTRVSPDLLLSVADDQGDIARLTDSFHLNLTAFGLLSFVVGLFIVHAMVALAFEQRRPAFRTLRSLGVPLWGLTLAFLGETLVLALVGGAAGMVLGYLAAGALLPDVAATLRGLYAAPVGDQLTLSPIWWISGMGVAVGGTLLAAGQSVLRLRRLPVRAPASPRAWAMDHGRVHRQMAALAILCAGISVGLTLFGTGLIAGFAILGGLLGAAALGLPLLLSALVAGVARLGNGAVWQWFWADTRQQLPGLSLALAALLLAVAANVGVSTMVGSFRHTFTGWLDQRLAAELYVAARDDQDADRLFAFLEARADAVLPIWLAEARLAGQPGRVYGVRVHETYRQNWPILTGADDLWNAVQDGAALLINEQMARRAGLSLGDPVTISPGVSLPVAGVYSDYGNPRPQAIVALEVLTATFATIDKTRFAIRVAPSRAADLRQELVQDFGLPPANITDQAAIKANAMQVFDRTFTVTAALRVLTLGVAGFAILTSLLTLSGMRLPQLAPVWALGLTRRSLAGLEVARTLTLALLTGLLAIPVGLLLAWALLAVVNVAAFGWRLPMVVFPFDWAVALAWAAGAGLVAVAWPALRLARTQPGRFLKVFANER